MEYTRVCERVNRMSAYHRSSDTQSRGIVRDTFALVWLAGCGASVAGDCCSPPPTQHCLERLLRCKVMPNPQ